MFVEVWENPKLTLDGYQVILNTMTLEENRLHFDDLIVLCHSSAIVSVIPSSLSLGHIIIVVMLEIVEQGAQNMVFTLLLFLL